MTPPRGLPCPVLDRLSDEIHATPGRRAADLAEALFDDAAAVARLQLALTLLQRRDLIERRGAGGRAEPYRYYALNRGQIASAEGDGVS